MSSVIRRCVLFSIVVLLYTILPLLCVLRNCLNMCVRLQDLTQYNTAHNRQISMVGISEIEGSRKRKKHPHSLTFAEEEEIINPEDVDPTIGRFRNMVQTTIIPSKVTLPLLEHSALCLFVMIIMYMLIFSYYMSYIL